MSEELMVLVSGLLMLVVLMFTLFVYVEQPNWGWLPWVNRRRAEARLLAHKGDLICLREWGVESERKFDALARAMKVDVVLEKEHYVVVPLRKKRKP